MFTNRFGVNGRNTPTSIDGQKPITSLEAVGGVSSDVYLIRDRVQRKLLSETEGQVNTDQQPQMRQLIENLFNQVLAEENLLYTRSNRQRFLDWVIADILGYGPIEPLLNDPSITEVMAVGPKNIYIERHGLWRRLMLSLRMTPT
jgi:pilus assembly protein CpaF